MALIRQNSIYIPDHISYKHELVKYRKMFIKYVKGFYVGNPFEWERRQRREFVIFHRRKKIIRKVNYIHGMTSPLTPNISDQIELLKGRKGLVCAPLKMQCHQSYTKEHRILNSKYFKCLASVQEMFLSSHGAIDKALPTLVRQARALNRIKSLRLYLNSSSTQEIDLSKGINQLLNTLNSFKSLEGFSFNLHDIQLSNNSLKELFKFNRLKRPIQTLQILTNRQLDMEDEFDDFFPPAEPKQSSEPIYKGFSTITSLAEHLVYLHLQPVLRDASDQQWLRYFFIPLAGLRNLRSLNLEMPNLELSENDVNVLSYSLKHLENLNTVKVLIQFGMISQKTLDNFFSSFECLNLRQVDLSLSFATVVDYSTFFKSIAKNKEIEKLCLNKTYLANMYFDPIQCDFLFTCLNLRYLRISALPLINGLLPSKERFNCCFKSAFKALPNLPLLESFSFENPKVSADDDNLRVITETLPLLHNLQELILVINWKEHEVSSEIGIQFWEVVLKKPMLKKLIINALFKSAEKIFPMIRTKIDNMTNLQCIAMHFASEVIEAQQVLGMVKRLRLCDVIKEIHLHFKVNFLLSEKIIQKIQQILKEPKYLKKCIVEIQSVGGKQSIDSESKSIFRGGQELNYF